MATCQDTLLITASPLVERFLRYVQIHDNDCWIWTGCRIKDGYGQIWDGSKYRLAHRLSHRLFKADVPDHLLVLHSCDTPSCVNPDHLRIGTYADNTKDAFERGRRNPPSGESHWNSKTAKHSQYIRKRLSEGVSYTAIAKEIGVCQASISNFVKKELLMK